jgi:hypothetical protein
LHSLGLRLDYLRDSRMSERVGLVSKAPEGPLRCPKRYVLAKASCEGSRTPP